MANTRISDLVAASSVNNTDVFPSVQTAGVGPVKTSLLQIKNFTLGGSGVLPVASGGTGVTSLTAGYIPFGSGTSPFGSSSNLFWDNANTTLNVLGSARPQSLNVYNTQRVLDSYEDAYTDVIFAAEDYNGDYPFMVDTANNTIVGTGNAVNGINRSSELLYIPIAWSAPTGTPPAYSNRVPLVFCSADNKLYMHNGISWLAAQFA